MESLIIICFKCCHATELPGINGDDDSGIVKVPDGGTSLSELRSLYFPKWAISLQWEYVGVTIVS